METGVFIRGPLPNDSDRTSLNTKKEKITFTLQCLSEENNYNKCLHRMCLSTSSFRFELPVSLIPFPKRQILDSSVDIIRGLRHSQRT